MTEYDTNRWVGIAGAALLLSAVGALTRQPSLVLAAAVGVAYAAYARTGDLSDAALSVERDLAESTVDPGDAVTVTVRVRNEGSSLLPDVRLVDGVPPALSVDGAPARLGTALRPGKTATFSYDVTAVRGIHEWEPLDVILRSASGSRERRLSVEPEVRTTLRSDPSLDATADLPLRGLTTPFAGRVETDVAGAGLEFHATREYRAGDPLNRIDWNRYARTGDLSTTQFREERAATVLLLVDAREEAYVAPGPGEPSAVEQSVDAATRAFSALLDGGDRVGVAALSPTECWLAPGSGDAHRARARNLLAASPALSPTPPDDAVLYTVRLRRLRRRLPSNAQVLLFSPVVDQFAVRVARDLDARGHLVTVVSPDPTDDDTPGHRLARVERANRLSRLRRAGVRTVDWGDETLATRLARAARRWSG